MRALRLFGLVGMLALALARPARAVDTKAAAVSAYDDGLRLMEAQQIAEACVKFGESQRLEPQLGTLLHLADCLEQNGQTASAWATFRDAADLAASRGDQRQTLAEERASALLPRLSKLRIEVTEGNDLSTLHVERDNVVVGKTLWGAPVPTDPGPHTIKASAPGRRPWAGTALVSANGSTATLTVPLLELEMPSSPETSVTPRTAEPKTSSPPAPTPQHAKPNVLAKHWPALIAGGVGLIGIGFGTGFGLKSKSDHDEAEQFCDGARCRDSRGVELKQDAISAGNVSTAAFIFGGVGLAAAGVLWFTLPMGKSAEAEQVSLILGPTQLGLRHAF